MISSNTFCQVGLLKGIVRNGIDNTPSGFINVQLLQYNVKIRETETDMEGNIKIDKIKPGVYDLKFLFVGYQPHIQSGVKIGIDSTTIVETKYPCPNGSIKAKKICPFGHEDNILHIVYGDPTDKTWRLASKGKIYIGGCIVTECSPSWHCKTHNINF